MEYKGDKVEGLKEKEVRRKPSFFFDIKQHILLFQGEEHDSTGVKRTRGGKLIEPRDSEDPAMRKMFAGNLCNTTSQEQLKAFFSGFGEVESCYCAINKTTGKCKGYGFVTMTNYEDALIAVYSLNGSKLADRVLQVRYLYFICKISRS